MIRSLIRARRTALVAGLLLPTLLVPSVALAGTLSKRVFKGGVEVRECVFTALREKCEIEFAVAGAGAGWQVEGNEWKGERAEERYRKTVGCTAGRLLKEGERCRDVIEMIRREERTTNGYCVLWELEGGGFKKVPFCTPLRM